MRTSPRACRSCAGSMRWALTSRRPQARLPTSSPSASARACRGKISDGSHEILDSIRSGYVSYIINTRSIHSSVHAQDGAAIRRCAVENGVTVFTSLDTVRVLLDVLEETTLAVSTIHAE